MSYFNKAKRIDKKIHRLEAKWRILASKIERFYKDGKITKDEYNSLAD